MVALALQENSDMGKHADLTIDPAEVVATSSPLEKPLVQVEPDPLQATDEPLAEAVPQQAPTNATNSPSQPIDFGNIEDRNIAIEKINTPTPKIIRPPTSSANNPIVSRVLNGPRLVREGLPCVPERAVDQTKSPGQAECSEADREDQRKGHTREAYAGRRGHGENDAEDYPSQHVVDGIAAQRHEAQVALDEI